MVSSFLFTHKHTLCIILSGDDMIIHLKSAVEVQIEFTSYGSICRFGGPLFKEEILIIAVLLYISKGDLDKPVGISYKNIMAFEKYELDITHKQFDEICRELSHRRGWFQNHYSMTGSLWINEYSREGLCAIYKFNHNLSKLINTLNYLEVIEKLLVYVN